VKEGIRRRLERVAERHAEVERMLADPAVLGRSDRFRELSMEFARLDPVARGLARLAGHERELAAARAMATDPDAGLRALAEQEVAALEAAAAADESLLQQLLVPADPLDDHNVFLEVRAAAGGDEAAIFAGDLFRMYSRFAERRGWNVEILSESRGEHGGYREVISRIAGRGVYAALKFESGTHRVQRVPATESQGRIHTSTCTVAVLPEIAEVESVEINPAELRIDTYRSSGAGGQHVNKTDSAVRITHLPSGIVVECQDERSQHKNRARAMALLRARLLAAERDRHATEKAEKRRLQVGSGDRSERIRTYNFPQGRLTDHRIELTLYRLDSIVDGDLDEVVQSLAREHQAEELAALE
jgi:peptide chain release factor 1